MEPEVSITVHRDCVVAPEHRPSQTLLLLLLQLGCLVLEFTDYAV